MKNMSGGAILWLCGVVAAVSGCPSEPPEPAPEVDAGCAGAGCDQEDATEPEAAPDASVGDATMGDVPDGSEPDALEPLACPESAVEIEGRCVPEAFLIQEGAPVTTCPEVRSPLGREAEPDCTRGCRGPQTPAGMQWSGAIGEPIHAPVLGVVLEVIDDLPGRPEDAGLLEAACLAVEGLGHCCNLGDGEGNRVSLLDRKGRTWTVSHLARGGAGVIPGQVVQAGQVIGRLGDSGATCAEGGEAGRVHVGVVRRGLAVDASGCLVGLFGDGAEPGACFDADGDTYGVGQGCDADDCDDAEPLLQSWTARRDRCLGADGADQACADRDGDELFAGPECPWPDEDCDDFDAEVSGGCVRTACACFEGVCCDGCQFLSAETTCAAGQRVEYLCLEGEGCGDDVFARFEDRRCSGRSAQCDGALVPNEPERIRACTDELRCQAGSPICAFDEACARQCEGDGGCAADQFCDQGFCVGDVCLQGSRFCVGNEVRRCLDNGGGSEAVEGCAFGCVEGACRACPDNLCQRLDLPDGDHCEGDARVTCQSSQGCRLQVGGEVCEGGAPRCSQGGCVGCLSASDCPSVLQRCDEANRCECRHECEAGQVGCVDADLQWVCAEDSGGCRHRVLAPCGAQEVCDAGACVGFCPANFCQDTGRTEGAACDGDSRVVCGQEGECGIEVERARCRGETRRCFEGSCVACNANADCRSSRQRCVDRACVCLDTCEQGEVGCLLSDQRFVCEQDSEGCFFRRTEDCGDNGLCVDGQCELNCGDGYCDAIGLGDGEVCDGARRVECGQRNGCNIERTWQECGCGCTAGACDPCPEPDGPMIIIGTGEEGFEALEDGAVVHIFRGFQGGHHVFGAVRALNLANPQLTQQVWRVSEGNRELAFWSITRSLRPAGEAHEHLGETVQFFFGTDPETLNGLRVVLELTMTTTTSLVLHDEVEIELAWP